MTGAVDPLLVVGPVGALLGAGILLVGAVMAAGRVRRERRRRREDADLRQSERLALDRLAWLTGRSEAPPEPPRLAPPPPEPSGEAWVVSPRRRLGRDTSAVLLVGVVALAAIRALAPGAPGGGVLEATSRPAPTAAPTAAPPSPTPSPDGGPGAPSPPRSAVPTPPP